MAVMCTDVRTAERKGDSDVSHGQQGKAALSYRKL